MNAPPSPVSPPAPTSNSSARVTSPAHGRTPLAKPSMETIIQRISPPTLPTPTQKFHPNTLTHIKPAALRAAGSSFFLSFCYLFSFLFVFLFASIFISLFSLFICFYFFCLFLLLPSLFLFFCSFLLLFFLLSEFCFFVILFMCYANIRRILPYVRRNRWPTRGRILQQHAGFCILNDVKISVRFCAGKQRMEVKKYGKFKQKKKGSAASVI